MGQYHKLVNASMREFVHPHPIGCGLKAWEILANRTVAAALAALISVEPGNGPADLANNKLVGRWAGRRILFVGDYAEDTDIPGFTPPLSRVYALCDDPNPPALEEFEGFYKSVVNMTPKERKTAARKDHAAALAHHQNLEPLGFYTEIRPIGLIEQGLSVRIKDGGWADVIHVRALATQIAGGEIAFELLHKDQETLDWHARMGITEADWNRPPRDGSWHGLRDSEIDQGQTRVLASLDRREFIDPVAFGEVPTTTGIMRGEWGSAAAMCALLFHAERRGGGDLYSGHARLGSWANTRLIASSERDGALPSTEEVRETFTDISDDAFALVATEKRS